MGFTDNIFEVYASSLSHFTSVLEVDMFIRNCGERYLDLVNTTSSSFASPELLALFVYVPELPGGLLERGLMHVALKEGLSTTPAAMDSLTFGICERSWM